MPRARKHLICVSETPYYHVTSRCVRRAFLCGVDRYSGRSYEHRRGWLEGRVRVLSSLFCVELCAYAIMSNHYHLVVRLCPDEAGDWSDDEVLSRWTALFRGPLLVQRYCGGELLTEAEADTLRDLTAVYRSRLASLSWFMKCLNEPIARKANAEDGCTGHFWEARFHSDALCSERALLAAMAYVDLNPVRAKVAATPEESDYTSIRSRLEKTHESSVLAKAVASMLDHGELRHFDTAIRPLVAFAGGKSSKDEANKSLPVDAQGYLKLLDITGRIAIHGKRGRIDPALAPVLSRLGLSADQWISASTDFRSHFRKGEVRLKQAG